MPEEDIYRKLQRHLDRMPVGFPATESGVEIRILKHLFTPEEARVALCLSAMLEPISHIHRRIKGEMSLDALREALDRMAERGTIRRFGTSGGPRYGKSIFVIGMYEAQVNRLTEEFERDARQYLQEEFGKALHTGNTPQFRTVPINETIMPERGIAPYDDIRAAVRDSEGPFAVLNCICRQGRDLLGEPCRQTHDRENCLTLGAMARAVVERGVGRYVTREEMLRMLDRADHEGLVLEPQNTQNPLFICSCCGCCCSVLTAAKALPQPAEFFSTNYYAAIDASACQQCGTCATRCQMDALATDEGPAKVNLSRCIGCGLCVSTCPSGAMRLQQKSRERMPAKDTRALYAQIFRERYGPLGGAAAIGRKLMGLKV